MTRATGPSDGRPDDRAVSGGIPGAWFIAFWLRLLLPRDRRDEFLGDLIEEARARQRRMTRAEVTFWLWGQAIESIPALVVLRARRRLSSDPAVVVAAAPPTLSSIEVNHAFNAFLETKHPRSRRRSIAIGLSLAAHAAVLTLGIAWTASRVDEVEAPKILVMMPRSVYEQPKNEKKVDESPPVRNPPPKTGHKINRAVAPIPTPTVLPTPPEDPPGTDDDKIDSHTGPGTDGKNGLASAPCTGGNCAQASVTQELNLPPTIAEKRCVSCPMPRLPPALMQIAQTQVIETRICIAADGAVASCQVLSGVDETANAGVCQTVRSWRMVPFQISGHPVPFCYRSRFVFTRG